MRLSLTGLKLGPADLDDVTAFLADVEHSGSAGTMHKLPRPGGPGPTLLSSGSAPATRPGGAPRAPSRESASEEPTLTILLPDDVTPAAVRGLGEGLWLASYRFRLGADEPPAAPGSRRLGGVDAGAGRRADRRGLALAKVVAESTVLARDLTNMPSDEKTPAWFAKRVEKGPPAGPGVTSTVRDPKALADEGFNAILAVGGGSTRAAARRAVLAPRGARRHIVLVGKGITFDTGGICIKPLSGMKLMRKDMGGAAAVIGATLAAAALRLPVRITALAPLAENALGADSFRPGDVVRHYGGITSEIHNTDAEGRLVLGDAMAYAVRRLRPDVIVDLATLTGAQGVALGKRTAALYSQATPRHALAEAAAAAGESMWRMPLHDDYVEALDSDVADIVNSTDVGAGVADGGALPARVHRRAARPVGAPGHVLVGVGGLRRRRTDQGRDRLGCPHLLRWLEDHRLTAAGPCRRSALQTLPAGKISCRFYHVAWPHIRCSLVALVVLGRLCL